MVKQNLTALMKNLNTLRACEHNMLVCMSLKFPLKLKAFQWGLNIPKSQSLDFFLYLVVRGIFPNVLFMFLIPILGGMALKFPNSAF